jgi:crotonobetainyl-CoA:carnitine CoA-transferase CaiB-like acyl-CoA transferase
MHDEDGSGATAPQALEGLRILDLSGGIAGPLGVLMLAEHGADVIKVEPPGGRSDRGTPAARVHDRSKRSITLDLDSAEGREVLDELCATADVLVEAYSPATRRRFGLGAEVLGTAHPHLVICSIPAWPSGSRFEDDPGWEALVHARSGQQIENTAFRPGPMFLGSPVASYGASMLVPTAIMSALLARDRTGRGQRVEVSLFQGVLSLTTQIWNWTDKGQFFLSKTVPPGVHQLSIYECRDAKWIHAATMNGITPLRSESEVLGIEEVDPATYFQMSPGQRAAHDEIKREAFLGFDRDELVEAYHEAGLGAEAVVAPHERFDHPQLRATGSVVEVVDPELGPTTQIGPVVFMERTPGSVRGPRPTLGAHTDEVLAELGRDAAAIAELRAKGVC